MSKEQKIEHLAIDLGLREGGQKPGQSGQGGQQPGQKGDQQGQGGGEKGEGELSDVFGGDNDNHMVDLGDLIKTMEDAGLQGALDKLQLPSSEDIEKIGQVKEEADISEENMNMPVNPTESSSRRPGMR